MLILKLQKVSFYNFASEASYFFTWILARKIKWDNFGNFHPMCSSLSLIIQLCERSELNSHLNFDAKNQHRKFKCDNFGNFQPLCSSLNFKKMWKMWKWEKKFDYDFAQYVKYQRRKIFFGCNFLFFASIFKTVVKV